MSQLAQFSSLEQMTNISKTMTSMATTTAVTQGVDLIGRYVTWMRADGSPGSGTGPGAVAPRLASAAASLIDGAPGEPAGRIRASARPTAASAAASPVP